MVNSWGGSIGIPVLDLLPHELHNFSVINSDRHQEYPCIAWRCKENYRANPAVSDLSTLITENQHRGQVSERSTKGIWLESLDNMHQLTHCIECGLGWHVYPVEESLKRWQLSMWQPPISTLLAKMQQSILPGIPLFGASRGSSCSWSGSGGTHARI